MERTGFTIKSFMRVKNYLKKHHDKEFSPTQIRNATKIDYNTVLLILEYLKKEKEATTNKGLWRSIE